MLHCDNWLIDLDEQIHSRINQLIATDYKMFRRPSLTVYKTEDKVVVLMFDAEHLPASLFSVANALTIRNTE